MKILPINNAQFGWQPNELKDKGGFLAIEYSFIIHFLEKSRFIKTISLE